MGRRRQRKSGRHACGKCGYRLPVSGKNKVIYYRCCFVFIRNVLDKKRMLRVFEYSVERYKLKSTLTEPQLFRKKRTSTVAILFLKRLVMCTCYIIKSSVTFNYKLDYVKFTICRCIYVVCVYFNNYNEPPENYVKIQIALKCLSSQGHD